MGIKGTVRRTTDGHLIHANIDTDIIISEEPPTGSTKKPEELYQVIERFAQGGHQCSGNTRLVPAYSRQRCHSGVFVVVMSSAHWLVMPALDARELTWPWWNRPQ